MCFNNATGNKKEFKFRGSDKDESEDFSLLLGDKAQPNHVAEMVRQAEIDKKKMEKAKAAGQVVAGPPKTTGGFFVPYHLPNKKKGKAPAHTRSASFVATSRDAWLSSHANKTNPPEVGKYRPNFN